MVVTEMRQKCRNNFLSAASVTRHPPLSGAAVTKVCALSPWASCAVLISKKDCNRVTCSLASGVFQVKHTHSHQDTPLSPYT